MNHAASSSVRQPVPGRVDRPTRPSEPEPIPLLQTPTGNGGTGAAPSAAREDAGQLSWQSLAGAHIGDVPREQAESVGLVCSEIWGGNRAFYGPIELPGIRGVLFSQPCKGARGGDVHYLSVCGSGLLSRICLADVTGHGEGVAAVSETMHESLRRSVDRMDQRKVLQRLNLRLAEVGSGSFTTAVALTYFALTRRLSISYAGHEPIWYCRASTDDWEQMELPHRPGLYDMALGVEPRTRYSRRVHRVSVGDRLLAVTDGVLETPSRAEVLFGRHCLADVLAAKRNRPLQEVVAGVLSSLREHAGDEPLHHDDVSMLAIEFVENLKSPALWIGLKNRLFSNRRRGEVRRATEAPL